MSKQEFFTIFVPSYVERAFIFSLLFNLIGVLILKNFPFITEAIAKPFFTKKRKEKKN